MLISLVIIIPLFAPTISGGGGGNSDENDSVKKTTSRVVHIKYGSVSGTIEHLDGRHLDPVEAFRGIPYASPPIGTLRFMPPVTGALWSGVKKAERFSPVCPQRLPDIANETAALERMPRGRLEYLKRLLPYLRNQSEDCLYLNIYVPTQGKEAQTSRIDNWVILFTSNFRRKESSTSFLPVKVRFFPFRYHPHMAGDERKMMEKGEFSFIR